MLENHIAIKCKNFIEENRHKTYVKTEKILYDSDDENDPDAGEIKNTIENEKSVLRITDTTSLYVIGNDIYIMCINSQIDDIILAKLIVKCCKIELLVKYDQYNHKNLLSANNFNIESLPTYNSTGLATYYKR